MAEAARGQRELLARHGLQDAVMDDLIVKVAAYEDAVQHGAEAGVSISARPRSSGPWPTRWSGWCR